MKGKNESKIILKQWVQVFIIIAVLILMGFSIWTIVKSVSPKVAKGEELYSYNYTSGLDYKVYIKPNKFYTMEYMEMNKQYITSLIDHIELTTKYNLKSTKGLDLTYNCEMIATAKGIFAEGEGKANEVWSKAYPLIPAETKTINSDTLDVTKTVNIDYNAYDQVMSEFRNEFGLSIESRVDVAFKITVTGGLPGEEKTLNESNTISLQMPLLQNTVQFKPNFVNAGKQTIYSNTTSKEGMNIPLLIFGIALLLFTLFMLKVYGAKLLKTTKKSEYVLQLNRILKEFGDIIAESDNLPDLSQYDVVSIKNFNDLVDIEEELHSPIIYTEIREDLESWFIITYDRTAYRYILRYEDFGRIIGKRIIK